MKEQSLHKMKAIFGLSIPENLYKKPFVGAKGLWCGAFLVFGVGALYINIKE